MGTEVATTPPALVASGPAPRKYFAAIDTSIAQALARRGVTFWPFDYSDPDSLPDSAINGDSQMVLVYNSPIHLATAMRWAEAGAMVKGVFLETGQELPDAGTLHQLADKGKTVRPAGEQALFDGPPLDFKACKIPPFPVERLPRVLRAFVAELSDSLQVPPELVFINCLAVMAVAAQRRAKVRIKPGYTEPLNCYAATFLEPGERKSAVVEFCKRPLITFEERARTESLETYKAALSERASIQKTIDGKRSKLAGIRDKGDWKAAVAEITQLEAELKEVPALLCLMLDDATPEAMGGFISQQNGFAGVIEAEGGLFDILAGRYSGVSNLDLVLKAWNGEPVRIHRKNAPPILLERPLLTLCISSQPDVLKDFADKPGFLGRGLIPRFWLLLPESRVGFRQIETEPVSPIALAQYADKITDTLGLNEDIELTLTPEAEALRLKFATFVEFNLRPGGSLGGLKSWGAKLPGNVIRLAGLLHFFEDKPGNQISAATMEVAATIAGVLVEHAKYCFTSMGADQKTEKAQQVLGWISGRPDPLADFTRRDCHNALQGSFPTAEGLAAALDILVDRNFIMMKPKDTKGPGRPSKVFVVNPLLEVLK